MEVLQILHMNKGDGENSYAKNSTVQSKILSIVKPITDEAILKIFGAHGIPESLGIADLGCSSGPNALRAISEIMDLINTKCRHQGQPPPEFRIYLNDLPSNDFNNVFNLLPSLHRKMKEKNGVRYRPCFFYGVPGSFYGRLFPRKSLHFVHSSSSLHWLSQEPPCLDSRSRPLLNKGHIYLSKTSPLGLLEAYLAQFQKDFSVFLKSRAEELVPGGGMVLSFLGRRSTDPSTEECCFQWELLGRALMTMVQDGLVEEDKVDTFNVPYYAPCPQELKTEIEKEGSFVIDSLESFQIDWDGGDKCNNAAEPEDQNEEASFGVRQLSRGQRVAKIIRAVTESMLETHFGKKIMDELFERYGKIVDDHLSKKETKYVNLVISMTRK